jgi:hypothetical protein
MFQTVLPILILLFAYSPMSQAYPDMIRHNYPNCTACHFSPAGGGLLNSYGRSISTEVLSRWGTEKEARPFYGALDSEKLNRWLQVGGNIRALQFHHESGQVLEGRTIPMQAGLDVAAQFGRWTWAFFFGRLDKDWKIQPDFVRYYSLYQASDEVSIRVGRFVPIFGLNIPQHTLPTRGSLGFGQSSERDTVETMWTNEKWNIAVSGSKSLSTKSKPDIETAISTQINYNLADSYRMGVSYWLGAEDKQHREIMSTHLVFGFSEHLFLLTESALQTKWQVGSKEISGFYHFAKLGYEITKGFHIHFVEDYTQTDFDSENSKIESFGPGFAFYPRPHFEFEGLYSKRRIKILNDNYEDYAYLLMHFYF